jgi:hypothetical protein
MRFFILALTLIPSLTMANLDNSVFNGSSTDHSKQEFVNDYSDMIGASFIKENSRMPASVSSQSENFKFPEDGYDAGTSVSN